MKHNPRWPSRSLQARGQRSHWIRPSSSTCQYLVATVCPSCHNRWSAVLSVDFIGCKATQHNSTTARQRPCRATSPRRGWPSTCEQPCGQLTQWPFVNATVSTTMSGADVHR